MFNNLGIGSLPINKETLALLPYFNFKRTNKEVGIVRNICKVEECNNNVNNKKSGLCGKHQLQMKRYGKILKRAIYDPNEFIIEGDICKIKLYDRNGIFKAETIIDAEDYDKVKDYKWCINILKIPVTRTNKKVVPIYKIILSEISSDYDIDHKDRDRLNNRKSNLRKSKHIENTWNQSARSCNSSGFKGVCWVEKRKEFMVQLTCRGKRVYFGYFKNKIEAAKAYDEVALKYHGEFACTNKMLGLLG